METAIRHTELSLNDELLRLPKQFSFEMAAYILEYGSQISFGKETNISDSPFKTVSINSFHMRGTEIEKISRENDNNVIYIERLAISGLNAPLPTPYAELIFRRAQEKDNAMGDFINAFNMRLLGISYQISKRRYLNLQRHDKNCLLLRTIAAFFGEPPLEMDRRMSRLFYLFWTKEKSAAGLEAIISSFLQFTTKVREIQTFWTDRWDVHRLGNMKLGVNSELGTRVSVSSFGVEIDLTHSDYREIFQLLTDQKRLDELKKIIHKYLGDFFRCTLCLTPQNVPSLELKQVSLGIKSWLPGKKNDSNKIIC
ncbi:MAG: type VI secretion system baseplate subunit TssG [Holosporaceae bacterium]|jgi:predicted component of type VI protein secretion system|nr:type VI secretion system baseplate subunit TssG [Holosporaceae bacterium]